MTSDGHTIDHADLQRGDVNRRPPAVSVTSDFHDREARYLLERAELQRRRARAAEAGQRPPR